MKKPRSMIFIMGAKKILSVNSLYNAKLVYKGSKPIATIYKSGESKKTEEYIKEQVEALDVPINYPWVNKTTLFTLTIQIIFKSGVLLRDLDNTIKLIQDGIFRAMGLNDSHVINIKAFKSICPGLDEEKICVKLEEFTGELRFDKLKEDLPVPERIFLGGTCPDWNGLKWRDKIIPGLEKKGISYFNPIVPDWTPECIRIEDVEKNEKCDCHLYILTPGMQGIYSVAEIINSAHEVKSENYGSMLCGILGNKTDWGESMWKSLEATIKMINELSGGSPKIVGKFLNSPEEILDCIGKPKRKRKQSNP